MSKPLPKWDRPPFTEKSVSIHTPIRAHRFTPPATREHGIILAALRDWRGIVVVGVLIGTAIFLVGAVG